MLVQILTEAKQEVPTWLESIAGEYQGGGSRNKNYRRYVQSYGSEALKSHSLSTRCVRTACSQLLTSLEQIVIVL